jgi:lipopolysaccharide/colanic/teichoic acid biosynthesis glycosyltransferase
MKMVASVATPVAAPLEGAEASTARRPVRTVWGLEPVQLHSRFWAARGIQVVRQGEPSEIVPQAELFLLADPRTMAIFRLNTVVEQIAWLKADLMFVRLCDSRDRGYREVVVTDTQGRFVRIRREYGGSDTRLARVALTTDQEIARLWQSSPSPREGWRRLRRAVRRSERWTVSLNGRVYDRESEHEVAAFVRDLVETWRRPDATVEDIRRTGAQGWAPTGTAGATDVKFVGPVWIGAGRSVPAGAAAVGPAVVWDDPKARPVPADIRWLDLEPSAPPQLPRPKKARPAARALKRGFDIVFALAALAATLPLYPIIALAILIEDGRPLFFAHKRESIGGRVFPCIKFRSMRKDAEKIKRELAAKNEADGPQFYMEHDPRLTRIGAMLRKYQLDELPQFINVLLGHMSVVGPRPSPFEENQYCPAWREARLSVRPGVTGLWQIKRTRAAGSDFQEWIRYDIEYVERASLWLDLYIIWKTVVVVLRGVTRS